ncbi:CHAT domain-containing protein [Dactylosporangium sucinum]|uniref:CHAT domain-containing protein n=1 Tax=Dactylosporangium sucinum TaxID=1424081 RepID=A0A917X6M2_9ACTN|nr:CHAT domain-containing protein [Dactylosporangium sucinum]GGM78786.1 CHAT domain-containing protein [Dactylosporangium sucinum]
MSAAATALALAERAMRVADTDPARAEPVAAAAVRAATRQGDPAAAALAERAWGQAHLQTGRMDAAARHLRRSIAHGERAGSGTLAGEARIKLAYALVMRGRTAAALAEIDAAVEQLDGPSAAKALGQRAVILSESGRLDEALAAFAAALPRLRAVGDDLSVARLLANRGNLLAHRHAFDAAVADLQESERLSRALGRDLAVGIVVENLGFVETLRGDVPAALAYLDRAERAITAHGGHLAVLLQDRCALLLSAGLAAEAAQVAERAVAAYRQERRELRVPETRLMQAQAAFVAGDRPAAAAHAARAAREFGRQGRPEWAAAARLTALRAGAPATASRVRAVVAALDASSWPAAAVEARLVAARADRRHAREHLTQAAAAAHRRGPATLRARGWFAEALLRLDASDAAGAAGAVRAGLRILDEHAAALGATDLRVHSAAHRRELTELGLRMALRDGRPRRVLEWAERGRASRLEYRSIRPPADPRLADLLAELRGIVLEEARGDRPAPTGRQVALERLIRDHTRQRRGTPGGPPTPPVPPAALAAALGDWALVEYLQLDGVLHGLTLAGGRLRLRPLGGTRTVAELAERLPFALRRLTRPGPGAALLLLRQAAARLDEALLAPFPELAGRPLVVVPTGVLHGVPWSVLPSCAGRPVTVAPSATLWHATTTRPVPPAGRVAVAAGPGLPGAHAEAHEVAAVHGARPLVGAAATVAAVLDALASAGLVHLAAHGRLSAEHPLFSDLSLTDGPLVVYDLEQLPRVPHTVVLAACDSGRSVVSTGDELLGLGAAFIGRGAAQLVASVLPVPDAETAPLMVALHKALAAGRPPAEALAEAQLGLADAAPRALAAAAGFVCLGSGREAPP